MDMDLKPAPQPQMVDTTADTPVPPAADSFTPAAPTATVMTKKPSGKAKMPALALLVLALIGAAGYGAYYWQHKQVDALAKQNQGLTAYVAVLNTKVDGLTADNAKLTKAPVVTPTSDELVLTAA
jgi:uncharacterized protein HemX